MWSPMRGRLRTPSRAASKSPSQKAEAAVPASIETSVAIVGGGPAGLMLGLLLARAGVETIVLEKHPDFLRDFRGDTIHPSTLAALDDIGLLDRFLKIPHEKVETLTGFVEDEPFMIADFRHLPTRCRFIAMTPQWNFLDLLAAEAERHSCFRLLRQAEGISLLRKNGRVSGARAETAEGSIEIEADLVVGCDGRRSMVREQAGLEKIEIGAPMDVMWFRLSRKQSDGDATAGRFSAGSIMVTINRGDYWQCAYVVPKGGADEEKAKGIEAFRSTVARLAPFAADRVAEIADWEQVSLLTVEVDRLKRWHAPGVLCIGDAAHAMSPVGGVGVNLAVQDAIATANLLSRPLRDGSLTEADLARVQARRERPTKLTQSLQVMVQNRVIAPTLGREEKLSPPLALRALKVCPALARLPARVVGMGFRPERPAAI
jgi:2-polyprenyl-6-methoxyphenol hydroxylase-like FAD-dependent oxidoreductase